MDDRQKYLVVDAPAAFCGELSRPILRLDGTEDTETIARAASGASLVRVPSLPLAQQVMDVVGADMPLEVLFEPREVADYVAASRERRTTQLVAVLESGEAVFGWLNTLTSLGFPVRLEPDLLLELEEDALRAVVRHFLHAPFLKVPIQPLADLVEGVVRDARADLWTAYREDIGTHLYVAGDGRVGLSQRHVRAGRAFGVWADELAGWERSLLWQELAEFRTNLLARLEGCSLCDAFPLCGGYALFHGLDASCCAPLRHGLGLLRDEAGQLKQDSKRRPRTPETATDRATVLLGHRCPNDCLFCAVADKRRSGCNESYEEIVEFIRRVGDSRVGSLSLSGAGEPTLDPHLPDYVALARDRGIPRIVVFTNGYGLDDDLLGRLIDAGATGVLVSLHGVGDVHDLSVRREGSFDEAVRALDRIAETELELTVNTCVTRLNSGQLPELTALVRTWHPIVHSLAFPEWAGNALRNERWLCTYTEMASALGGIEIGGHIVLDNVPSCVAPARLPRAEADAPILYHEAGFEMVKEGGVAEKGNVFPRICRVTACPHLGECCGLDARYLQQRGADELYRLRASLDFRARSERT